MEIKEIHKKLSEECPPKYRINEIIPFGYPYRRVKIKAQVSKPPEKSLEQIYITLLKTIKNRYDQEKEIIQFLGLDSKDDFVMRELYFLREQGYIDLVSEKWLVTEGGEKYIKDNTILSILETEKFEFFIDAINGEVIEKFLCDIQVNDESKLKAEISIPNKSPELLKNKNEEISDVYKKSHSHNETYFLIDYDADNILFDKEIVHKYYLIEYIPENDNQIDPYIEIRNSDEDWTLEKRVTDILEDRYPDIIYELSPSDRKEIHEIEQEDDELIGKITEKSEEKSESSEIQNLSIWETQDKFKETLKTVKSKILIESPWIKRATLQYIQDFEKILKKKKYIIILYGIEEEDNHHPPTIKKLEELKERYSKFFYLIHLPTHFEKIGNQEMTGTHRKLLIKDEDYFILGSFNFLSFNKKKEEGQKIANEETVLIKNNVENKWTEVLKKYKIDFSSPKSL